jgi:hypothetical protein
VYGFTAAEVPDAAFVAKPGSHDDGQAHPRRGGREAGTPDLLNGGRFEPGAYGEVPNHVVRSWANRLNNVAKASWSSCDQSRSAAEVTAAPVASMR